MLEILIPVAIAVVLVAGFWWTRGGGGMPGGVNDPAFQRFLPRLPKEREDRENEIE